MAAPNRSWAMPFALGAGWLLWAAVNLVSWAFRNPGSFISAARVLTAESTTGFVISLGLAQVYRLLRRRFSSWRLAALAVTVCALTAPAWRFTYRSAIVAAGWDKQIGLTWPTVLITSMSDALTLGMFSLLCFMVDYWQELTEQREKALRAAALAHQAQLQMLRYQLNPHFLFNALNSIRSMIAEDTEKARQMVTELSEFLRHSLDGDEKRTTIGGEIKAIENYLEIQRIRFEEKLQVTTRIEDGTESVAIPCFLIHPLVENAVKYGMQTSAMPLEIEILVERSAGDVRIVVRNTGRLLPADANNGEATGTGLKNIAQRLDLVFPGRHVFELHERDGWVEAVIRLTPGSRGLEHADL